MEEGVGGGGQKLNSTSNFFRLDSPLGSTIAWKILHLLDDLKVTIRQLNVYVTEYGVHP